MCIASTRAGLVATVISSFLFRNCVSISEHFECACMSNFGTKRMRRLLPYATLRVLAIHMGSTGSAVGRKEPKECIYTMWAHRR